ncbi:hypothetical protein T4D_9879 [Trichinella pseudospiralis]|uniref:Uncharacterized protein n=1 Tax=Trichinella pseudospiralis TaxID=6337 RepID=A0A0V1FW21_TRIPS|nr:hypothetical protein T4D_9879 [Trichinella pseudospiralis]
MQNMCSADDDDDDGEQFAITQSVLIIAITELEQLNGFLLQNELINRRRPKKMHREEVVVHGMSRVK